MESSNLMEVTTESDSKRPVGFILCKANLQQLCWINLCMCSRIEEPTIAELNPWNMVMLATCMHVKLITIQSCPLNVKEGIILRYHTNF